MSNGGPFDRDPAVGSAEAHVRYDADRDAHVEGWPTLTSRAQTGFTQMVTSINPFTGKQTNRRRHFMSGSVQRAETGLTLPVTSDHQDPDLNQVWQADQSITVMDRLWIVYEIATRPARRFLASPMGQSVFKCSIAYLIASLATFIPAIGSILGKGDGKHVVATITVYFHPARAAGSMVEAIGLAALAFTYAAVVTVCSTTVSALFNQNGMLYVGYAIVLLLFCGGGLGFIGWVKQKFQDPLINVACSLASLAIITILTKEGHVQSGVFSLDKVFQVLKMVVMGISISAVVNFLIKPVYAQDAIRTHLADATSALRMTLYHISDGFLNGGYSDRSVDELPKAVAKYKTAWALLKKYQHEARYEHYIGGTVEIYSLFEHLIDSIETLNQDLGGLQSAATMVFDRLESQKEGKLRAGARPDRRQDGGESGVGASEPVPIARSFSVMSEPGEDRKIVEVGSLPTASYLGPAISSVSTVAADGTSTTTTVVPPHSRMDGSSGPGSRARTGETGGQMGSIGQVIAGEDGVVFTIPDGSDHKAVFRFFIKHLGPPMRGFRDPMMDILRDLPYPSGETDGNITVSPNFSPSLNAALDGFTTARSSALGKLRNHKIERQRRTVKAVAHYEEIAAGCGHFCASLEDFGEDLKQFVNILHSLSDLTNKPVKRSWGWLQFWRSRRIQLTDYNLENRSIVPSSRSWKGTPTNTITNSRRSGVRYRDTDGPIARRFALFRYRLWQMLRFFRRDDTKYAFKVGIGAVMYAVWSFVPATRPLYSRFRGEWGLVSYMLVCSMMVGASNTTASERIFGTCMGAVIAIAIWVIADENGAVLALAGWAMSFACFYLIVGLNRGPMGRYVLLTYNLSALYGYSLTIQDRDDDEPDDEIDFSRTAIAQIVFHRVVAVIVGCLWGIVITRLLWPIQARRKLRDGLAILWLRTSIMWRPDSPLSPFWFSSHSPDSADGYEADVRTSPSLTESIRLQRHIERLRSIKAAACNEITLKGPFRDDSYSKILDCSSRIVDAFYALSVLLTARRDPQATTAGERQLLKYTVKERNQLTTRVSHLFSVLASSILLGYPSLPAAMPKIESSRDQLLVQLYQFRYPNSKKPTDEPAGAEDGDYDIFYAYTLITGQMSDDLDLIVNELNDLFGELDEEAIVLWD